MSKIFKAIADPTRRDILLMLCKSPTSVNKIAERFEMSRPAVSKHIRILEDSELVRIQADTQDARQRNCYAQLSALQEVRDYFNELERFWDAKLNGLEEYLNDQE